MTLYIADFSSECERCGTTPCVAVHDPEPTGETLHQPLLCGTCFFRDRSMIDPELWNEPREATE